MNACNIIIVRKFDASFRNVRSHSVHRPCCRVLSFYVFGHHLGKAYISTQKMSVPSSVVNNSGKITHP